MPGAALLPILFWVAVRAIPILSATAILRWDIRLCMQIPAVMKTPQQAGRHLDPISWAQKIRQADVFYFTIFQLAGILPLKYLYGRHTIPVLHGTDNAAVGYSALYFNQPTSTF